MVDIAEARLDAITEYMNEHYPDFEQYVGSINMFALRIAFAVGEAEERWFMTRCLADEESHD